MSNIKKLALLGWLVIFLLFLAYAFKSYNANEISKAPVLIHEAGHLYTISGQIYFRRCSVDGLDHFDLTGIDPKTFQYVNDVYIKDKNSVWNLGETKRCEYPKLLLLDPSVDVSTFSAFATSSFVAKDKIGVIYNDHRLASPSKDTVYLGFGYYKDANQIWKHVGYGNIILLKGVPADARPLSINYLADNINVYDAGNVYSDKDSVSIAIGADPTSFKELDNGYSLDKNNVYYKSKIVLLADSKSFIKVSNQAEMDEHCGFSYWKDVRGVYLNGNIIQSADPNTFKVVKFQGRPCNAGQYSMDKEHVFYDSTLLSDIDISTFIYKGEETVADSNSIYVEGSKCVSVSTLVEDAKLGYSLQIPKGWNYVFESQYGADRIFDCESGKGFYISKGSVTKYEGDKKIDIVNQLIPKATITGWSYDGEDGGGYRYQIVFPQRNASFIVTSATPIEDFSLLSSLISIDN